MADPREFTLIGSFTDGITPSLEKINNSIANLKRTFAGLSSKRGGYGDITKSIGSLVSAQKHLADSVKEVKTAVSDSIPVLRQYKKELGGVTRAHFAIARATSQAARNETQFWNQATKSAQNYNRVANGMQGRRPSAPRSLSSRTLGDGGGGGGGGGPRPPGRGGSRGGGGYDFHMGAFAFGMELGQGISQPIQSAVFSGFQLGTALLSKTMQYVQSSFAERVQDQMTDLQAAGGYYAISKRQKDPMFGSLQSAIMFTQKTNDVLERLAADLPGTTEDYVKVSKRIGDSVMRLVDSNEKGSIAYAKQLLEKGSLQESYRGVSLEGPQAREGAIQVILGELTKKTVMAGFGGSVGRGGVAGAYGLPALTEQLITNPDVSMARMQKYASVFGDPKIISAMERAMPKLKEAGSDMLKRTIIINEMYDEIAPPEMIAAMRKSMTGVLEAYRSAFFSPGTGLFGFGRKLKDASGKLQPLTDVYGRFVKVVEENGKKVEKIVETAEEASQVDMAVFDMFADIVSNYAAILKPIIDNLSLIWDPMEKIGAVLRKARIISVEVLQTFRNYVAGLEKFAEGLPSEGMRTKFLESKSLRASLLTITNLLTNLGVFSQEDFSRYQKMIIDPSKGMKDLGKVLNELFKTFFDSDAAKELGKFVGELVKSVIIVLSDMTGFANQMGASKLGEGFMEGFGKDGIAALKKLFGDIYSLVFKGISVVLKNLPWEAWALAGMALLLPAAIAGIGMSIGQGVVTMLTLAKDAVLKQFGMAGKGQNGIGAARELYKLDKSKARITGDVSPLTRTGAPKSAAFRAIKSSRVTNPQFPGVGVGMTPGVGGVTGPFRAPKMPKGPKVTPPKGFKVQIASIAKNALPATGNFLKGLPGRMGAGGMSGLRNPLGMLGKFGSVLTIVTGALMGLEKILSGGSIFEGLGAAAGPIIGTIIGTALLGPLGGIIGSWVGQQESVINGLANIFENLAATFGTLNQFALTLAKDIGWLASKFFGLGEDFDWLGGLMRALEAPFYYMRLGMLGIYELYLKATGRSKSPEADSLRAERVKLEEENRLRNTLSNMFKGYSPEEKLRGLKGGLQRSTQDLAIAKAEGSKAGVAMATTQIEVYKQEIAKTQKPGTPAATAPPPKPGAPAAAQLPAANPAAVAAQAQAVTATATNTQQLNQKAAQQVTQGGLTQKATEETKKNTAIANTTLGNIRAGIISVSNKLSGIQNAILGDLNNIQAGVSSISSLLASGGLKVKAEGMGPNGGPLGSAQGNLGSAQKLAAQNGLGLTSWFRSGDKGYHGLGRAMDFSNGVDTPQQMDFAQQMVAQYGTTLKELIYTPLGFGIKDGTRVPLSYWGPATNAGHYDHVHVAFANGLQDGKMFSSQSAAGGWENSMVPGSVRVASITGNSAESFGGSNFGNINVTVNAGATSDPDTLASIVAMKIGEAVADARASSLFV